MIFNSNDVSTSKLNTYLHLNLNDFHEFKYTEGYTNDWFFVFTEFFWTLYIYSN